MRSPASTLTTTHTHTTRIEIACAREGGATRLVRLSARGLLRARALRAVDGVARVALVQTAAALLAGDRVELDVRCGPGCRLELLEVAGMVAHDVRAGEPATLRTTLALARGARVHWASQPLILAGGCALRRTTDVELEAGAALLWRDTLVLGRAGETPGRLQGGLEVRCEGRALHAETLDTGDAALLRSAVVLGDARVLDVLGLYGVRADDDAALQLAGPGSVLPVVAPSLAAAQRRMVTAVPRWRRALFDEDDLDPDPVQDALDDVRLAVPPARVG